MLAHPTGRLRPDHEGGEMDLDAVLRACAANGVVVEINANPRRLDLDWRWHQRAMDMGCLFCVSPDAHGVDELDHVRWGLATAHKGGIHPDRLLNFMTSRDIGKLMRTKRARSGIR
jgi:DNA polymerase (family 10)